ncbi:retrovirus-related pol polyprotein from transposon TNT 1-94 [Tanacetum coccineum]
MNNKSLNNQDAPEIQEFFNINEWQAKLNAKDVSIANLRKHIESLKGKNVVEKDLPPNKSQEVLVYVSATYPSLTKPSEKLVAITPLNKNRKVRIAEPATSSSNTQKQVESHKTQDSNKPVLPSIRMKSSTTASRSQPLCNTKKNRISQTTSSNMKNKVKDNSRSVKSNSNKMNRVSEPICNVIVKHTMLNANFELICVKCNQCMFDANHDVCFLKFVNDVNVRSKSKSAKSSKMKNSWKPTVEPLKETTSKSVTTPNPEIKIYRRKTKVAKSVDLSSEPKEVTKTCYTQNRSLIYKRHNKTPYELLHNKKPDLSYLHVFGALCYPTNDSEDLGKVKPKADIEILFSYAPTKKAYRINNKRTRLIIATIYVDFDEPTKMASEQFNSGPGPQLLTPGTISSRLMPNPPSPTPYVPLTKKECDILFQLIFDEYFNPPPVASPVPAVAAPKPTDSTGTPSSTSNDQDAPSPSTSQTPQETQSPDIPSGVKEEYHDIEVAHLDNDPYFGALIVF